MDGIDLRKSKRMVVIESMRFADKIKTSCIDKIKTSCIDGQTCKDMGSEN